MTSRTAHLLAVASPTADLAQFAREALWMAQERDLGLTLAVRRMPRAWSQLMGHTTAEDLTGFAERWGITLIPWRTSADIKAILDPWALRPPTAVLLGPRKGWGLRDGLAGGLRGGR